MNSRFGMLRALAALALAAQMWASAPARAETAPVTLLAAGDIAFCDTPWWARLFDWLRGLDPEPGAPATADLLDQLDGTILALGDLAYRSGSAEEFRDCYGPTWGRHKERTWPVPGNHEYNSDGAQPYFAYWGSRAGEPGRGFYSRDLGAWHIVALDSNLVAESAEAQLDWLRADLATSQAACILAFWHHPPFSSGKYWNEPAMADAYRVLYEAGASLLLAGHGHNYERFAPQDPEGRGEPRRGLRVFVVGTGGMRLRGLVRAKENSEVFQAEAWGVLKLTLYEESYKWEFVPVEGSDFRDTGSASCAERPQPR